MAGCLPWLRQGDVFELVPCLRYECSSGELLVTNESRTAVLITDNCQLDKRTNSGRPRPTLRLQFVPLGPITDLGHDIATRLRNGDVNPPEAFYVGTFDNVELAGRLGEVFSVPAEHFTPAIEKFSDHPEADRADPHHLVIAPTFGRLFTMDPEWIERLYEKMSLFWTHRVPRRS
jgi:hypothetical protein